jgi:DNA helicase-2/ATP-dependent DNA helicase PcrA
MSQLPLTQRFAQQLNTQQHTAATFCDAHSLILAWAGSWKTRTLTYKIAWMLASQQVAPDSILAVTFTNKAAHEMKSRLVELMEVMHTLHGTASYQWRQFPRIGTFHSICLKLLKQDIAQLNQGYTSGFTIYDASGDVPALLRQIIKELVLNDIIELNVVQRTISGRKNKWWLPPHVLSHLESQQDERIHRIYTAYQQQLRQANALDFDDLLLLSKLLLEENPAVRTHRQHHFKAILVDEAQDTNTIQFALLRLLLGKDATITFIGDDYQSIYRRRGAVMHEFLQLEKWLPDMQTFKLETNYRSRAPIVKASNALIKNNKQQYDKELEAHKDGSQPIRVFRFQDDQQEAIHIIDLISKMRAEHQFNRSDFTILYRTNAQSSPFEQVLLTEWIPYQVVGAFKFFERKEIKDCIAYCKWMLNPADELSLRRIINVPQRKIGETSVSQAMQIAHQHHFSLGLLLMDQQRMASLFPSTLANKLNLFTQFALQLHTALPQSTPAQFLDYFIKSARYEEYLVTSDGKEAAEEKMQNLGQLVSLAGKYEQVGKEGLQLMLDEITLLGSLDEVSDKEPDALKLMTVHASKWLEFPSVFVTWLEEGIFPLAKAAFDDAELEEERRALYVAMTRAREHLFLSYVQARRQWGQMKYYPPSRFIEELPAQLIKTYDMSSESPREEESPFEVGDSVVHTLFGKGVIVEIYQSIALVKFFNARFGLRKLPWKYLKAGK